MQEKQELSKKEPHYSGAPKSLRSEMSPVSFFNKREKFEIIKVSFQKKEESEEVTQEGDTEL